jgi:hypothetical protein
MNQPICVRCKEDEAADNDIQYCVDCFDDASDEMTREECVALELAGVDLDDLD